jgi:hypothetical protein
MNEHEIEEDYFLPEIDWKLSSTDAWFDVPLIDGDAINRYWDMVMLKYQHLLDKQKSKSIPSKKNGEQKDKNHDQPGDRAQNSCWR